MVQTKCEKQKTNIERRNCTRNRILLASLGLPLRGGITKIKNPTLRAGFFARAQNRNRTCTLLPIPDFESDASTSSAIWALKSGCNITESSDLFKEKFDNGL
jgi:hypothetical protein